MRTYGNKSERPDGSGYKARQSSTRQTTKSYATRTAYEWDLRIDIIGDITADIIVEMIKMNSDKFIYSMVSGIETPDDVLGNMDNRKVGSGSSELHVHIGLITIKLVNRDEAIRLCMPSNYRLPPGSIYAVPRNNKYPFAGWVCHHSKDLTKLDGEPGLRHERGILPLDSYDLPKLQQIKRLVLKFGNAEMKERFKHYLDMLTMQEELKQVD